MIAKVDKGVETMRAWQVEAFGSLDNLVLRSCVRPVPMPGQVVVRVAYAALNFADMLSVQGRYQTRTVPPFILGSELAGVVSAVADDVEIPIGARVMAQVPSGAYAEYCLADARRIVVLDPDVDLALAAATPVSYTTASVALFRIGRLEVGQTVLVHAAAGAAGLAAVRLAREAGARVIAAASSAEKRSAAVANGAEVAIDNRSPDWVDHVRSMAPDGVDLVFDPVGGDITLQSVRLLRWGGRILLIGFASGSPASIPANQLLVRAASACGVFWDFDVDPQGISEIQRDLARRLAQGAISPVLGDCVPFASLKDGLNALAGGRTIGKLVLDVREE